MESWMRHIRLVTFLAVASLSIANNLEAWDDGRTHRDMSEVAADFSVLGTKNYLKNVGLSQGLEEQINGKPVREWMREGARLEDAGTLWDLLGNHSRFNNHFHNPLKPWNSAGLNDTFLLKTYTGISSLLWAQDGAYQQSFSEGDWSWQRVRERYYLALTAASDADREAQYAATFRGLGHQMHLIQDAGQPDHVRNDIHAENTFPKGNPIYGDLYFEAWAMENYQYINTLASNPLYPDVSYQVPYTGLVSITQLIDRDIYAGTNPATGLGQGLAEYANANFFTDDTIFAAERYSPSHRHWHPYPRRSSTDLQDYIDQKKAPEVIVDEDGVETLVVYISKVADGETVGHFIRPGLLTNAVYKWLGEGSLYYATFYRDERCHEDYAIRLIPRAVGYSAALIDYFFRIEMEVSDLTPKKDTDGNITEVALRVKNATQTGEALSGGKFWLNVRYKTPGSTDPTYQISDEVLSGDIPSGNDPKDDAYKYTFPFPSYIPKDAANLQYTLAYRGPTKNLAGQVTEPDAVAGKVYSPERRVFVAANNSPKDMLLWGLARTKSGANLATYISISHQNFYRGVMQGTFEVYAWDEQGNAVSDLDLRIVVNPAGQDTGTLAVPGTINIGQDGHATIQVTPGNEVLGPGYLRATFRAESTDGKIQSNVAELHYTEPAAITATIDSIEACYRVGEGWSGDPYDCPGISGDWSSETKTWKEGVISPINGKSVPPVFTDGAINTLYFFDTHDPQTKAVFQDGTVIPLSGLWIDDRGFVEYVDNKNPVSDEYAFTLTADIKEAVVLGAEDVNLHSVTGVYLGKNAPKGGFDYFAGGHFFGGTIILGTPLPADGSEVTVYFRRNLETERVQYVQ